MRVGVAERRDAVAPIEQREPVLEEVVERVAIGQVRVHQLERVEVSLRRQHAHPLIRARAPADVGEITEVRAAPPRVVDRDRGHPRHQRAQHVEGVLGDVAVDTLAGIRAACRPGKGAAIGSQRIVGHRVRASVARLEVELVASDVADLLVVAERGDLGGEARVDVVIGGDDQLDVRRGHGDDPAVHQQLAVVAGACVDVQIGRQPTRRVDGAIEDELQLLALSGGQADRALHLLELRPARRDDFVRTRGQRDLTRAIDEHDALADPEHARSDDGAEAGVGRVGLGGSEQPCGEAAARRAAEEQRRGHRLQRLAVENAHREGAERLGAPVERQAVAREHGAAIDGDSQVAGREGAVAAPGMRGSRLMGATHRQREQEQKPAVHAVGVYHTERLRLRPA